jgi:hypothetical protein
MARTTLTPNRWFGWTADVTVEVEKVKAPPFAHTAYAVYVDDVQVGYAISQREMPRNGFATSASSRDLVVTNLVERAVKRQEDGAYMAASAEAVAPEEEG